MEGVLEEVCDYVVGSYTEHSFSLYLSKGVGTQ